MEALALAAALAAAEPIAELVKEPEETNEDIIRDLKYASAALDGAIQTKNCLHMGKYKNHLLHRIYELKRLYTGL